MNVERKLLVIFPKFQVFVELNRKKDITKSEGGTVLNNTSRKLCERGAQKLQKS